eukprot:UN13347
MSFLNQIMLST